MAGFYAAVDTIEVLEQSANKHNLLTPPARICHYEPYEITALRRLTAKYGIGEAFSIHCCITGGLAADVR